MSSIEDVYSLSVETMNSNSTTIDTANRDFQMHLETLSQQTDVAWSVAREALEYDDPKDFFHDLARHGCISGMVGSLIRYTDTHAFFNEYYDEIQCLKDEWEENVWQPMKIEWDIKNFLAWFSFEETAYQIASEWEVY